MLIVEIGNRIMNCEPKYWGVGGERDSEMAITWLTNYEHLAATRTSTKLTYDIDIVQ